MTDFIETQITFDCRASLGVASPDFATVLDNCSFTANFAGTGNFVIGGSIDGAVMPSMSGAIGGLTYRYYASYNDGEEWEQGNGRYNIAAGTLERNTVSESSNNNQLVDFSGPPTVSMMEAINHEIALINGQIEQIPGAPIPVILDFWYRTTADFTKSNSAALSNIPDLSANLEAGRTYIFRAQLFMTYSGTNGNYRVAVSGTCTATNLRYDVVFQSAPGFSYSQKTALNSAATDSGSASAGSETARIDGTITVNAGGTLTLQFAQSTADAVDASLCRRGSYLQIREVS